MGYGRQMRILLWKNCLLKRRSPVALVVSFLIPLAVCSIMAFLRTKIRPYRTYEEFPAARPLLSAGVVPILQQLTCAGGSGSPHGFTNQQDSLVETGLYLLHRLTEHIPLPPPPQKSHAAGSAHDSAGGWTHPSLTSPRSSPLRDRRTFTEFNWTLPDDTLRGVVRQILDLTVTGDVVTSHERFSRIVYHLRALEGHSSRDLPLKCTLPPNWKQPQKKPLAESFISVEDIRAAARIVELIVCDLPTGVLTSGVWEGTRLNTDSHGRLWTILEQILKKKLKILYSPVDTDADRVIHEAAGLLNIITDITVLARAWLITSEQLRHELNRTLGPLGPEPHELPPDPTKSLKKGDFLTDLHSGEGQEHVIPDGAARKGRQTVGRKRAHKNPTSMPWTNPSWITPTQTQWWGRPSRLPRPARAPLPRSTPNPWAPVADIVRGLLDVMDVLACQWLKLADRDLNFLHLFKGFRSEEEVEDYFLNKATGDNVIVLGSIIFDTDRGMIPPHARFKLRQNATFTHTTRSTRSLWWEVQPDPTTDLYYSLGYSFLQELIERAIVNFHVGHDVSDPGVYLQRVPHPCAQSDDYRFLVDHMLPVSMLLAYMFITAVLARDVVYEKERRLREVMVLMGLSEPIHWLGWLVGALIENAVLAAILTLVSRFGGILPASNTFIVFIIHLLYSTNAVLFAFLISCFFSQAKMAAATAGIGFIFTYLPHIYITTMESFAQITSYTGKCFASLLSSSGLALMLKYVSHHEASTVGLQWHNIWVTPLNGDTFSAGAGIISMVVSIPVFMLLIAGVELAKFVFRTGGVSAGASCLWRCLLRSEDRQEGGDLPGDPARSGSSIHSLAWLELQEPPAPTHQVFEAEPTNLNQTIVITNLTKVYRSGKVAVNNLTLNLYEDQILSFLGHNGAGKSTTMAMLTGMLPITSGTALIHGYNVRTHASHTKKLLGVCPQYNVLFDSLTVEEHLSFYSAVKSPGPADEGKIHRMITDLGLEDKRRDAVSTLSGGMKRKLSVGVAFIGGSRAVVLDEPTAGVDPCSRREIWDLLIKYKKGRTIMLSTHHMDEADILGDRIAIISRGALLCCGSSIFLKGALGEGYHLRVVRQPVAYFNATSSRSRVSSTSTTTSSRSSSGSISSLTSVEGAHSTGSSGSPTSYPPLLDDDDTDMRKQVWKISLFISSYVPGAYLKEETRKGLHFVLPFTQVKRGACETLFRELDAHAHTLGVASYGVSDALLEEVFLKVIGATGGGQVSDTSIDSESQTTRPSHRRCKSGGGYRPGVPPAPSSAQVRRSSSWDSRSSSLTSGFSKTGAPTKSLAPSPADDTHRQRFSGSQLYLSQLRACLRKRALFLGRNWSGTLVYVLLPLVLVSVGLVVALIGSRTIYNEPPLPLTTRQYVTTPDDRGSNYITVSDQNMYAWSYDADSAQLLRTFRLASGVGAVCLIRSPMLPPNSTDYTPECFRGSREKMVAYLEARRQCSGAHGGDLPLYRHCYCEQNTHLTFCDSGDVREPALDVMPTGDIIHNISSINETLYLYSTGNTDRYLSRRYGGLSLGNARTYVPRWMTLLPFSLNRIAVRHVIKVFYDSRGFHSIPIYINAINNAILRANLPPLKGNPAAYGISVTNHPMNETLSIEALVSPYISRFGTELGALILMTCGLAFVPASHSVFLVYERTIKAKHLQYVSGLSPAIYWTANLLVDMGMYSVLYGILIGVIKAFNIASFTANGNLLAVVALLAMFGFSSILMVYPLSLVFDSPSSAFVFTAVINMFSGFALVSLVTVIKYFFDPGSLLQVAPLMTSWGADVSHVSNITVGSVLDGVLSVFPTYATGSALMAITVNQLHCRVGLILDDIHCENPMGFTMAGKNLTAMACVGIFCFLLVVFIEYKLFIKPRQKHQSALAECPPEGEDVEAERRRVAAGDARDVICLRDLCKVYKARGRPPHTAVNRLSLGIPMGECFGMLGVNGAGKTTTFMMLTGDLSPTLGDATIDGHSILSEIAQVRQRIGYCPQYDALFHGLTARQHLHLYASIRGMSDHYSYKAVDDAIDQLGLTQYADQRAAEYSGGNRRKLSTAIALLGDPKVILLDEPTAGMDPYAKRFLWNLITLLRQRGHCLVLTSHSMEECERLCTRMAVMQGGRFLCLGSAQHLKDRYGDGYTLRAVLKGPDLGQAARDLLSDTHNHLPEAAFKDQHYNTITMEIPRRDVNLSRVFRVMRRAAVAVPLLDYSVCQNTLDNVFINLVKTRDDAHRRSGNADPEQGTEMLVLPVPESSLSSNIKCTEDLVTKL